MGGELYSFTLVAPDASDISNDMRSGWFADCADDQGVPFSVGKLRPELR